MVQKKSLLCESKTVCLLNFIVYTKDIMKNRNSPANLELPFDNHKIPSKVVLLLFYDNLNKGYCRKFGKGKVS